MGGGTGDDARELARGGAAAVLAERRQTHADEARRRGLTAAAVADGAGLPFPTAAFDGCVADRVLQHARDPLAIVSEMVRVIRPGGRLVTVDPDLDTQVASFTDVDLARRAFRYRCNRMRPSGTVARRTMGLSGQVGLANVTVEARTLVVHDPSKVDNVMGLRDWAGLACAAGVVTDEEAEAWPRMIDEAVAAGRFLYAVTYFLTTGQRR